MPVRRPVGLVALLAMTVSLVLPLQVASAAPLDGPFRLTLLHNNDGESALLPGSGTGSGTAPYIGGIARFGTLVEELRVRGDAEPGASGTLLVSSGDNYLAGPQLQASLENFDGGPDYSDDGPFYDALAMDRLRYDASAVGNHEFDFGPDVLGYFISQFQDSNIRFVSSNLDVEGEQALQQFVAAPPGAPGTLVEWTRTTAAGVPIAIVGATTPRLASISSPGPDVEARAELVPIVQQAIDAATSDGTSIVLFISHLQNVNEDRALIAQLSGVDAAVAGGGDELLANDCRAPSADPAICNTLLPNEGTPVGPYPLLQADAEGGQVPIVTTPGSYSYVGRLVLDFDAGGAVTGVDPSSGPVRNVFVAGATPPADQREPDPFLLGNVERPVAAFVQGLRDERVAGTEPELDGRTPSVRTRETNLGSLFADALVRTAEDGAAPFGAERPVIGITNSGGIRNSVVLGPDGAISRFDTFQIAPFSNFVAYALDVSPETVKQVLERAVSAATTDGALQPEGRFVQVSGLTFRYDPAQQAQQVTRDADGAVTVTTPGARVRDITLTRGTADPTDDVPLYRNGVLVAGAPNVDLASNSFSLANGDNLPFNLPEDRRVNLPVSYQQSLEAYLRELQTVLRAQYPEGGLGRIVVGSDVTTPDPDPEPEPEPTPTPTPNRAPVADAGGPYTVRVGRDARLDAGGSSDPDGDTLTFTWDLDGDGAFADASGPVVTLSKGRPPGSYRVAVQVSDGQLTSTATATLRVVTPGRGNGGMPPGRP